jgi:two-component system, OmpR family, sensor kinase
VSLRARLLASLGLLLAVSLAVSGAALAGVTRANLVAQVDADLRGVTVPGRGPGTIPRDDDDPTGRRFAYVLLARTGDVIAAVPSGFGSRPDPLPVLPDMPAGGPSALVGQIVQVTSADGSLRYRVLFVNVRQGRILALAAPLAAVDGATAALVRNLLLVGGLAVAGVLGAGWLILRRGLRPLETMAATADRIATGDLAQRAGLPRDMSEVGRLGTAFDAMLDRIQAAFERQQAALEAKEQSEERLRRFVADASHELRTPITAVVGYADLYRAGGLDDPAELERAMARIGTEGRRMASLVEDLLLLARLDQGRPLRRDAVDLSRLVGDAVADARAVEPDRSLGADIRPGVTVAGDEDRLRQVLGNLLGNVRVHAGDAACEVSLDQHGDVARVTVADHGPGIDAAHASRVFDRFYRADAGRSRGTGGSGLGLSIAASIIAAHDGRIEHVPTPGGGATFRIELPAAAAVGFKPLPAPATARGHAGPS